MFCIRRKNSFRGEDGEYFPINLDYVMNYSFKIGYKMFVFTVINWCDCVSLYLQNIAENIAEGMRVLLEQSVKPEGGQENKNISFLVKYWQRIHLPDTTNIFRVLWNLWDEEEKQRKQRGLNI